MATSRGVDAVTGLEVFVYDFLGPPRIKPGQLETVGAPTVLAAGYDGTNGVLVTTSPAGAKPLLAATGVLGDEMVLQALETLRDAAKVSLVHGDIGTHRLFVARGQIYVEGYGVPWGEGSDKPQTWESVQAGLRQDLLDAATALKGTGGDHLSAEVSAALGGVVSGTGLASSAAALYTVIRRLAGGVVKVPPATFGNLTLEAALEAAPEDAADADAQGGAAGEPDLPAADGARDEGSGEPVPDGSPVIEFPQEPDPIDLGTDPGLGGTPGAAFVKELPPDATYHAGDTSEETKHRSIDPEPSLSSGRAERGSPAWRLPTLLIVLLLLAVAAGYLTLITGANRKQAVATAPTGFAVAIATSPSDLGRVNVVVDAAPAGSSHAAGALISDAPRQSVLFDVEGTWTVHGVDAGGATSPPVTFTIPTVKSVTLTFPSE